MKSKQKFMIYGLTIILLVLTSSAGVDFITRFLPQDNAIVAYAGLVVAGPGALIWLQIAKKSAGVQRWIAIGVTIINGLTEVVLLITDLTLNGYELGVELSADETQFILIAFGVVVGINFLAGVSFELLDPDAREEAAEKEAEIESHETSLEIRRTEREAELNLHKAVAREIKKQSRGLAAEQAPQIAADWIAGAGARLNALGRSYRPALPPGRIDVIPSNNGNSHKEAVKVNPFVKEQP